MTATPNSEGAVRLSAAAVPAAFDGAATGYDRLVGLNPGYHAALRRSARNLRLPNGGAGQRVLDLGCGTGASTAALLAVAPHAEITGVDASAGMLASARAKAWPDSVRFVRSRVEDLARALPEAGRPGAFDAAFAAYLVRNLPDPDPVLRAVRELLRPGAPLVVHEYSVRDSLVRSAIWTAVCTAVIIPAAYLVDRDTRLYTYLLRSVLRFDGAGALRDRLRRAGFTGVRTEPVGGWQRGIVHTFVGHAPVGSTR